MQHLYNGSRRHALLAALAVGLLATGACSDDGSGGTAAPDEAATSTDVQDAGSGGSGTGPGPPLVFNGQGNNLDAYSGEAPFASQRVIINATDDPRSGLDINAQICFYDDDAGTRYMIVGEDTDQDGEGTQGWGIFELTGERIGELEATQVAKLVPTYSGDSNPENYGCGRLSDGRIVTGDVGNQAGGPGTGQLIVWFPPFDSFGDVSYCKLELDIGTAGQILVGDDDSVYIASSLGRSAERPSGVYRYEPPFPEGPTARDGCGRTDPTGAPLADSVQRSLFIDADHGLSFPAGIVSSPAGGFYVSSQATGVINEYDREGAFVRTVLAPDPGEELDGDGFGNGSPHGLGIDPDGTLYYADIGIVRPEGAGILEVGPGEGTGSVRRIAFDRGDVPGQPEVIADGLDFPDGIGVLVP